jgi:hypothetical protein
MKKITIILVALMGFGISALAQNVIVLNDNNDNLLAHHANEISINSCNVSVYQSGDDIRYTNECDESVRVRIVYRYKTCSNVARNGRMVKEWSEWSKHDTIYRNLSARYSNATIASGNNCLKYDLIKWDIVD